MSETDYIELASLGAGVGQYTTGAVAALTTGTIEHTGTSTPVTTYANNTGSSPNSSGTFTTDSLGRVPGWILRNASDYAIDITIPPADPVTVLVPATGSAPIPITQHAGNYTLAGADLFTRVEATGADPRTFTIPTGLGAEGDIIELGQVGVGKLTVAADGGVTLNALGGLHSAAGQFATLGLLCEGTNVWLLSGQTGS